MIRALQRLKPLNFIEKYNVFRPFRGFCSQEEIDERFVAEITNGDADSENRLRMLMLEVEVMRQEGKKAPEAGYMKRTHWETLMELPSRTSRHKHLQYLFRLNMADNNVKAKKLQNRVHFEEAKRLREEAPPEPDDGAPKYDLSHNSMFIRIYEKSLNDFYNRRATQAMLHGQKLVLDCSYDSFMVQREAKNAAKQMTHLFGANRMHAQPFDLHLCNCDPDSHTMRHLHKNIPTLKEPHFPLNIHPDSYLNHFPKQNLVYLTPHCRTDLAYDPDDVYIVGCMVDKVNMDPLSLAKAKENNLRMARLPLDKYLQWGEGSGKSLTINQVVDILLDLAVTGDWEHSLRHVPRRKLAGPVTSRPPKFRIDNIFKPESSRGLNKPFTFEARSKKPANMRTNR